MIHLQVVKQKEKDVKNQFVITANEPVTIEFIENANGDIVAHVYQGNNVTHLDEPVGAYDSTFESKDWTIE